MTDSESYDIVIEELEHDLSVIDDFLMELHLEAVETEQAFNEHKLRLIEFTEGYESIIELLEEMGPEDADGQKVQALITALES